MQKLKQCEHFINSKINPEFKEGFWLKVIENFENTAIFLIWSSSTIRNFKTTTMKLEF